MRLDVSKALAAEGNEIPFAVSVELPETAVLAETVRYPSPGTLAGTYTAVGQAVHLRGELRFVAEARCVRCLKPTRQPFRAAVDAQFVLVSDPDNPDVYVYDGAWIDPEQMAADAALLALPMQFLCGAECKGLCPVCGADQNEQACSCRLEGTRENPFAALGLNRDESEV